MGGYFVESAACLANSGVEVKGNTTPSAPASKARFAVQSSFTGTRINGTAFNPRVASTILRAVSRVMGECSISIHKKSKPMFASVAATSALATVTVAPITGLPSRINFLTGFSQSSCAASGRARTHSIAIHFIIASPVFLAGTVAAGGKDITR